MKEILSDARSADLKTRGLRKSILVVVTNSAAPLAHDDDDPGKAL